MSSETTEAIQFMCTAIVGIVGFMLAVGFVGVVLDTHSRVIRIEKGVCTQLEESHDDE